VNEHNRMILKSKFRRKPLKLIDKHINLFDKAIGNVIMPCEWRILIDVVAFQDVSDVTFIVFHQVVGQRHLLR
jgi:hypothetical protein